VLKKKGISLSPSLYFITALSYMALGLFSTLVIGVMMSTIGEQLKIDTLVEIGKMAISLTGPAIAVAVGFALEAPPLVLFASIVVGGFGYQFGGPAGSYVAALIAIELGKLVSKSTKLDIILTPFTTVIVGYFSARFVGKYIGIFMEKLGDAIEWGTSQQPILMGILVAVVLGLALTGPISSAALSIMLGLSGLAAGAATVGCAAQMIGFAVTSYRDNGIGGAFAQGIGTSKLQFGNVVRNPWIIIPPTISAIVLAPIAITVFDMQNNAQGAGMGTSGFVGPLMMLNTMGFDWNIGVLIIVFLFLAPAVLSYIVYRVLVKWNRIKPNDMKIEY